MKKAELLEIFEYVKDAPHKANCRVTHPLHNYCDCGKFDAELVLRKDLKPRKRKTNEGGK